MGNAARARHDGDEPLDPTVREFLPWHVVRQKLAERGAVLPPEDDAPPSGVRISEKEAMNDVELPSAPNEEGLSFKVYTLEDLERRHGDSVPPVIRPSMAALADQPKAPSPWLPVGKALLAMAYAVKTWVLLGKGRPAFRDAFRAPAVVLGLELRNATKDVAWRRLGFALAAGVGTVVVLLFAVLTVAELTDDLKPARTDGVTTMMIPPNLGDVADTSAKGTSGAAPAPAIETKLPEPAVAAPQPVDELDTAAPAPVPAPKAVKKPATKKAAAPKKKPAKGEIFVP